MAISVENRKILCPLGIGYQRSKSKNRMMGLPAGLSKKFDDIFSRLDTIHQRDRQTDGRTDGHRQRGAVKEPSYSQRVVSWHN